MKLLLTGFEPFDGRDVNSSQEVVTALTERPDVVPTGVTLITQILPVDGEGARQALSETLERERPEAALLLGEAAGRAAISIERVFVNLRDYDKPDNLGARHVDLPIVAGGVAAYFATIPARRAYAAIRTAGVPVELSLSAGAFLCNELGYAAARWAATSGVEAQVGFMHLPLLPMQAALEGRARPSLALEDQLRGVAAALEVLAQP